MDSRLRGNDGIVAFQAAFQKMSCTVRLPETPSPHYGERTCSCQQPKRVGMAAIRHVRQIKENGVSRQ